MKIGTREIGPGHSTFVVAEGGSNHGGSLDAALALTDAAAAAGADAMKWQLWFPDEMYEKDTAEYESAVRWRLNDLWLPDLRHRAHQRGMAFGLSSFGMRALDVADVWVDFHKVASIEATWREFLIAAVNKKKTVLVSNGMSEWSVPIDGWSVIPLHCTVSYPAALDDVGLRSHPFYRQEYDDEPRAWGLSDHTTHPTIAPCAAVALGACVVEKHLRLGINNEELLPFIATDITPDWNHSLNPSQFAEMVFAIRLTEKVLGSSEKRIRPSEEPYLKFRRGPRGLRGA